MGTFKLGISSDFQKEDGSPAFPTVDLAPLDDPRIDWRYVPVRDGAMLAEDMAGLDALILLAGRFDAQSVPDDGKLTVVARFGVGYDTVDVDVCSNNDIALVITPSGVRRPVAVAILTFILALSGKLMTKDRLARGGPDGWAARTDHMGIGLVGLTLGSIGIGNIGAEMFRMAAPLDMKFIAHDPFADAGVARELGVDLVSMEEVFQRSDFLAVNCPLSEATHGLVNAERLALMKPTAFLINTARGPIVDQDALTEVLKNGGIAGAGLDVFREEPSSADDPIFALDNVIATPHALCWTDQCFANIGAADIEAVFAVMEGRVPEGIVNREITKSAGWTGKLKTLGDTFGRG